MQEWRRREHARDVTQAYTTVAMHSLWQADKLPPLSHFLNRLQAGSGGPQPLSVQRAMLKLLSEKTGIPLRVKES